MSYEFKITHIHQLDKSKTIILDGELLSGVITTNSEANLQNMDKSVPVRVMGIVLDGIPKNKDLLSLSIRLNKDTKDLFQVGDILVA